MESNDTNYLPPYRDAWITLEEGYSLRGLLNRAHDPDQPGSRLFAKEDEGYELIGVADELGIAQIVPVFRDELLESYEQLALQLPVFTADGGRSNAPNETAEAALQEFSAPISVSDLLQIPIEKRLEFLDSYRSRLPMFHPYYRVRARTQEGSPDLLVRLQKLNEIRSAVEAPRLARDAWAPQDHLIAGSSPDFSTAPITLYSEDWQPKLRQQWNLAATEVFGAWQELSRSLGDNAAPFARGITVAIIDSGIQYGHPDFQWRARASGSDECLTPMPPSDKELDPHGTLVAGIIGARSNERGICGIAPECSLLSLVHGGAPLEVDKTIANPTMSDLASPAGMEFGVSDRVEAMVRAIRLGAGVINASWHVERTCCDTDSFFSTLEGPLLEALLYAMRKKVPVVCSVGNRSHLGYPQGYISYPAAYDGLKYKGTLLHVISVGAVDQNLQRTPSSNFLPTDDPHLANHPAPSWPTLMAPGYSVPTTDFEDRHGLSKGCYIKPLNVHWPFGWVPDYAPFGGTSAAAPHVTGVIALMMAKRGGMRQLTVAEIKGILTATAVDITAQQRSDDPQVAVGMTPLLLNAAEALRQVP